MKETVQHGRKLKKKKKQLSTRWEGNAVHLKVNEQCVTVTSCD